MSTIKNNKLFLLKNNIEVFIADLTYEFHRELINNNIKYIHYTGKLTNFNSNNFPEELFELLKEKRKLNK